MEEPQQCREVLLDNGKSFRLQTEWCEEPYIIYIDSDGHSHWFKLTEFKKIVKRLVD